MPSMLEDMMPGRAGGLGATNAGGNKGLESSPLGFVGWIATGNNGVFRDQNQFAIPEISDGPFKRQVDVSSVFRETKTGNFIKGLTNIGDVNKNFAGIGPASDAEIPGGSSLGRKSSSGAGSNIEVG